MFFMGDCGEGLELLGWAQRVLISAGDCHLVPWRPGSPELRLQAFLQC